MGKTGSKRAGVLVLRGSALATVDDHGRLKLPAGFRRTLEAALGRRLYLTSLVGDSMWVYPLATWQQKEQRILDLGKRHPAVEKFIARTGYFGAETDLDGNGRILVPQVLRASARLAGEVAVLGALDHLEVWNNSLFKSRMAKDALTDEDHRTLAELRL